MKLIRAKAVFYGALGIFLALRPESRACSPNSKRMSTRVPINVFAIVEGSVPSEGKSNSLAWLCETDWELPSQLFEFEQWLERVGTSLPKRNYVADIGFTVRPHASGGGGTLSVSAMQILIKIGMEVWFSEYPK